jgi:hypothetical protein
LIASKHASSVRSCHWRPGSPICGSKGRPIRFPFPIVTGHAIGCWLLLLNGPKPRGYPPLRSAQEPVKIDKDAEKRTGFVASSCDFQPRLTDKSLRSVGSVGLTPASRAGACQMLPFNTLHVIRKRRSSIRSSPSNWKLSWPGNRSVTVQSRDSWSGHSAPFWIVEFWSEVS